MTASIVAPALASGSRVRVVAPAGPVDARRLRLGLSSLEREFEVNPVAASNLGTRTGYFAGDDALRLRELQAAMADPDASAVWCARGGYGLTRLLSRLDPEPLRRAPKLLIGFSDVSALLCWADARLSLRCIHGPVVCSLGHLGPEDNERLLDLVRGDMPAPLEAGEGTVMGGGTAEGRLVATNLEVLRALVGTPFFPSLEGSILALEEVGERPYRIDRALTQLRESGVLRGLRGVVVGDLLGCVEPEGGGSQGMSAAEVFEDRLGPLGIPLVTGFAFGHDPGRNAALPFGARVRLRADHATLEFMEPAAAS